MACCGLTLPHDDCCRRHVLRSLALTAWIGFPSSALRSTLPTRPFFSQCCCSATNGARSAFLPLTRRTSTCFMISLFESPSESSATSSSNYRLTCLVLGRYALLLLATTATMNATLLGDLTALTNVDFTLPAPQFWSRAKEFQHRLISILLLA